MLVVLLPLVSANVNECDSEPCQNGVACIDKVNGFMCTCPPEVTGQLCEGILGLFPVFIGAMNFIYGCSYCKRM